MDYLSKIAQDLGMSRSSVYRAIKHMKPMSAETRKRVIEYIKANYPEKLTQLNSFSENRGGKHIAVIMPYKPEYFWKEASDGMEAARESFGDECPAELKFIFYAGTISENELISILDSIEVSTADALCVVPVDTERVAEKINDISRRIPVAIFNEVCRGAVAFLNVVSNGYAEGRAVGKMVTEQCPAGSHIIRISTDDYTSDVFNGRMRGFGDAVRENYFIDEVSLDCSENYYYHTILPSLMARKVNEKINRIESAGGSVSATYVTNGALLPLFIALRKLDRQDISVFGHEINESALEFYKNGMRGGYVKQDIYMQGYSVINGLIRKLFYDKDVYPEIYNTAFDSDSYSESGHERNEQNGSV